LIHATVDEVSNCSCVHQQLLKSMDAKFLRHTAALLCPGIYFPNFQLPAEQYPHLWKETFARL
jgi:hypothetical protein